MQKITVQQVKEAARRAYEEGKLTAQSETPYCLYSHDGCRCAIGAAMDGGTIDKIAEHDDQMMMSSPITTLIMAEIVEVDADDVHELVAIQEAHDNWCSALDIFVSDSASPDECRERFLDAIA